MDISTRINAFSELSKFLLTVSENKSSQNLPEKYKKHYIIFEKIIENEYINNGWFVSENIKYALKSIALASTKEKLTKWLAPYNEKLQNSKKKIIAVILAGNIPIVGFHDFISVLISGNIFLGKLSSKDKKLMYALKDILLEIEPKFKDYINLTTEKLTNFDAVIATGSDNSTRYFKYYFGKYPHIIRSNRNSIAVLTGEETKDDFDKLATDIFMYFGLGCRSISKIFVPENYNFDKFYEGIFKYKNIIEHNKYANNYTYNRTIYLMKKSKFYDNGFLMLVNSTNISSPISVLFFEYYSNIENLSKYLNHQKNKIQCVVSKTQLKDTDVISFGKTQQPELWDYADNIDILEFIISIT